MISSPAPSPAIDQPWNPFVVPLVGVACTFFLVLTYYKILPRHCCAFDGLTFSRTWNQRQLLSEENPEHDISLQFQSRGPDSFIMHSFPITQFKKKNEEELGQSSTDCAVCLGEFEEGEWVKHLPNCSHAFHVACIDTWFQTHSSCHLCRSYVYDMAMHHEYTVSMDTLLETLRREDFIQDRSADYQALRSHILQNSSLGIDLQNAS